MLPLLVGLFGEVLVVYVMTPGSVVAVAVVVLALTFNFSIHKIEEGHVGVYFRGGALLSAITFPGN